MPGFIRLTVLLLANNEVIVCSRYCATQSVAASLKVIKLALTQYETIAVCGCLFIVGATLVIQS